MNKNLSTKRLYITIGTAFLILTACFIVVTFYYCENLIIRGAAIIFSLSFLLLGIILIFLIRKKLVLFTTSINNCIDHMIIGKAKFIFDLESETLNSKLNYKLKCLYEIMEHNNSQIKSEKQVIQEMISDISHQVKMPVTNLKMYNSTLLERQLTIEKQREFLTLMETQINKLDFLMQSLVKMSRLETGIIAISVQPAPIYDTVGLALGNIVFSAEQKHIEVTVDCDSSIIVPHDKKWTVEALSNILDNAVKYTPQGGKISVTIETWETMTKIAITDTGKGIPEQHLAQIFKRFYREDDVHNIDGIGIGLYLCREIISKQGGYIQVKSIINMGSTFSVFLPNER